MAAVKSCIKTCYLRKTGVSVKKRPNGCKIVRLVKWRQGYKPFEFSYHLLIDHHWTIILWSAMHDAVPDCDWLEILRLAQPCSSSYESRFAIRDLFCAVRPVDQLLLIASFRAQPGSGSDTIHLPFDEPMKSFLRGFKDLEFDAGGPCVYDENGVHDYAAGSGALVRRACAKRTATAQEAIRDRTESARDVRIMGTRAPRTMPAESALARNERFFASMLPASRSGTTSICARPATSDLMPLIFAASGLIALSNASGPSRIPPVI